MADRGRPTKYTPDRVKRILEAIKLGVAYIDAASYAGVGLATFNEWRDRYPEFAGAVEEAAGQAVVANMAKIQKAATEGSWQASAWILERRHPDRYGRTTRTELTGPDGGPVQTQASVVIVPGHLPSVEAWAAAAAVKSGEE